MKLFCRHTYLLWYFFDPNPYNMFWHVFKIVGFCLCFINSCVNPLALYLMSRQFRRYYNQYLLCACKSNKTKRGDYSNMYSLNSKASCSRTGVTMLTTQTRC